MSKVILLPLGSKLELESGLSTLTQTEIRETATKSRPKGAKPRISGAERKAQILDVAAGLFGTIGYQSLKMTDIAKACGITKPVLYSHFPSKDALFEESLMNLGGQLSKLVVASIAAHERGDESAALSHLQNLLTFVQLNQGLWSDLHTSGIVDRKIGNTMLSYRDQVANAVARILAGQRPARMTEDEAVKRIAPLAHALIGAADGGARWWQTEPDVPVEEAQRLTRLVLDHFMTMTQIELGGAPDAQIQDPTPSESPSGWRATISKFID